jgi:hypothetical protein
MKYMIGDSLLPVPGSGALWHQSLTFTTNYA